MSAFDPLLPLAARPKVTISAVIAGVLANVQVIANGGFLMSPTANLIVGIVIGGAVLFFALKFGFAGAGGVGAYRNKNPFNYWFGVSVTAIGVLIALAILILTSLGVMRP